jgi:hypothetical protein
MENGELKMDNVVAGRLSVSFLSFSIPRRGNGVIRATGTKNIPADAVKHKLF